MKRVRSQNTVKEKETRHRVWPLLCVNILTGYKPRGIRAWTHLCKLASPFAAALNKMCRFLLSAAAVCAHRLGFRSKKKQTLPPLKNSY